MQVRKRLPELSLLMQKASSKHSHNTNLPITLTLRQQASSHRAAKTCATPERQQCESRNAELIL